MPGIEEVVHNYDQAIHTMQQKFGADPDSSIDAATERLKPLNYSLDIAWQMRTQEFSSNVINDPRIGALDPRNRALSSAMSRLEKTGLRQHLQDWLLEADTFKEHTDEAAIVRDGAALLEAIGSCYDIASERSETRELQPDLLAITRWVQARMKNIQLGRQSREAVSVTHKMYLELGSAITQSKVQTREDVRKAAVQVGDDDPDAIVGEWDDHLAAKADEFLTGNPDDPYSFWQATYQNVLSMSESLVPLAGRKFTFTNLFAGPASPDFKSQIETLYQTIDGDRNAKNYVMKVRDAAWDVQNTIDTYLRRIAGDWRVTTGVPGDRSLRDDLTCTLCVLSDRVLKEVNFIILSQLAPAGSG